LNSKPVYQGHDGVRQAWRDALSAFGKVDFDGLREATQDRWAESGWRDGLAAQAFKLPGPEREYP
jgi:hypothetical protein